MNILIIEDEIPAANQLIRLLENQLPDITISGPLNGVAKSEEWLNHNPAPDLIFLDIHLADGSGFEIFKKTDVPSPVIFCTAFDQYAIEAFKLNSIDYLLKPVDPANLKQALEKYERMKPVQLPDPKLLLHLLQQEKNYKKRFVTKVGSKLQLIETKDISFFFSADKATFVQTENGRQYSLDQSLDQLQEIIDPRSFYRINRKYLINIRSIVEVVAYSSNRLKLKLKNYQDEDVLVSRERTAGFKAWLDN